MQLDGFERPHHPELYYHLSTTTTTENGSEVKVMINDECTNEKGDIRTVFWLHTTITIVPSRFSVIIAHYLFGSWI